MLEAEADGGVVLRLDDDVDEQRVLDLARASGDVLHFTRVRPSLAELFREVVSA
jgi:ABC-2 type transport system ATP-binding protein